MDERVMKVFMMELVNLGKAMALSADQYNLALQGRDTTQAFLAAQSIVTTGALVSKILSAREKQQHTPAMQRCTELNNALGFYGELPQAIRNRKVRNSMEHFDERLDSFFGENPNANFFDRNIGPRNSMIIINGEVPRHMRFLDNTTHTLSVLEDEISLQEVANAVLDIARRAQQWLVNHEFRPVATAPSS